MPANVAPAATAASAESSTLPVFRLEMPAELDQPDEPAALLVASSSSSSSSSTSPGSASMSPLP